MRNEIFQQIKKNREAFFSELMNETEIPELNPVSPCQSQINPKKKLDKDKIMNRLGSIRLNTFKLDEVIKPWFRSVLGLKKRMTNHTRRIIQRINDEADRIKLQMADFLLLLFSDEEFVLATVQSEAVHQPSSVSGQSPADISSATREIIFYLTSKPALAWGNLLKKSFSQISAKRLFHRTIHRKSPDLKFPLRANHLFQKAIFRFHGKLNRVQRILRLPTQALWMNPFVNLGKIFGLFIG